MAKSITELKKRKRSTRGSGRLFKKVGSKQLPAESNAKGNYYLTYTANGKRITQALRDADNNPITDRDLAEAERKRILAPFTAGDEVETLRSIQAKLADAESRQASAIEQASDTLKLVDAWDVYDKHSNRPQSGEATMQQYAFQWRRFLDWMRKNNSDVQAIKAVTTQAARNYHADLLKAGLSPATVNKHIGLLRLVFSVINAKPTTDGAEEVLPNPFDNIKPKKHKVKSRRELTTEELRRIIDMASGEIKLLFAIGVYTGMRLGDCATLKWDEVEFDRNRICRIPNKTAANEKPVKIPLFATLKNMLQDAVQSKKGIYVLPETAILYHSRPNTITSRIQRLFWNAGIDCHAPGTGSQIVRGDNGEPIRTEGGNVALDPTGTRGVVQCGFHSLRHTFVSLCSEANTPMSVVQSIVGHSNPAMTRHYSHTSELEAAKAVAALPDITTAAPALPTREPVPAWARELLETQTVKNWKKVRSAILAADKKDVRAPKQIQS